MRYVIIRDDDTNAFTPVECLERLYRPALERGMPVNLSVIPEVSTEARMANGQREGFLPRDKNGGPATAPIASSPKLARYLLDNRGYQLVQHGLNHDYLEFERPNPDELARRLERGTALMLEAGFARPQTFVAPYDRLSRAGLREVARRFRVLSSSWYELRQLPYAWWPRYALRKACRASHWRVGRTLLLTHPGCLLSYQHTYATMLGAIIHNVTTQRLTVLVTHWWEYFRDGQTDQPFIDLLHETIAYLAGDPGIKIISFSDLLAEKIPLN